MRRRPTLTLDMVSSLSYLGIVSYLFFNDSHTRSHRKKNKPVGSINTWYRSFDSNVSLSSVRSQTAAQRNENGPAPNAPAAGQKLKMFSRRRRRPNALKGGAGRCRPYGQKPRRQKPHQQNTFLLLSGLFPPFLFLPLFRPFSILFSHHLEPLP